VPKTAAKLQQAGVKFAFQSGGLTTLNDFFTNAGKSVEGGLSKDAAIRAMTLSAAEILDINNRLGSIEPGKIANLAVVKNDVFASDRFVPTLSLMESSTSRKSRLELRWWTRPGGGRGPGGGQGAPLRPRQMWRRSRELTTLRSTCRTDVDGTMVLTQQGDTINGTMTTQLGVTPIRGGKATADGFTFAAAVEFGGASIDIAVKATVAGNALNGTIDSPQGTVSITGTKVP
jgi:hypothetical protein